MHVREIIPPSPLGIKHTAQTCVVTICTTSRAGYYATAPRTASSPAVSTIQYMHSNHESNVGHLRSQALTQKAHRAPASEAPLPASPFPSARRLLSTRHQEEGSRSEILPPKSPPLLRSLIEVSSRCTAAPVCALVPSLTLSLLSHTSELPLIAPSTAQSVIKREDMNWLETSTDPNAGLCSAMVWVRLCSLTESPKLQRVIRACSKCVALFCSILFCSVLFCSVLFCSVLFCSIVPL